MINSKIRKYLKLDVKLSMDSIFGIVSAFRPTNELIVICENLLKNNCLDRVFVVDDGNLDNDSERVFKQLLTIDGLTILRHQQNKGQGAGVKTVINHIHDNNLSFKGLVLFDADGQHCFEDICRVIELIRSNDKDVVIMGSRRFNGKVPFRSMLGNSITRYLVRTLFGIKVYDSQSGLRGFGHGKIPELLRPISNRYEYVNELNLFTLRGDFIELPVSTIYFGENSTSSFRPLLDSFFIYKMYFKYFFKSLRFWVPFLAILAFVFFYISK